MTISLHVYPSPIVNEGRIMRETASVAEANVAERVIISGTARKDLPRHEQIDARRQIVRLGRPRSRRRRSFMARALDAVLWSSAVVWRFGRQPVNFVNAHSVAVLPLCALLAHLTRARLIYDTHELETETIAAKGVQQAVFRAIEGTLIRRCSAVFVVNASIADWYRNAYPGVEPVTVRNIPPRLSSGSGVASLREQISIPESSRLFVHVGNIGPGRNIEPILEFFTSNRVKDHVVFLGDGPMLSAVQQAAKVSQRVHWLPPVPPNQVVEALRSCTIGLCLIEPSCLSYQLSLPNKAMEYISAGVPFFHTSMPEVNRLLGDDKASIWQLTGSVLSLQEAISKLTDSDIEQMRLTINSIRLPDWDDEAHAMISVYRKLTGVS